MQLIILQIPTSPCHRAKIFDQIIKSYLPSKYSINATHKFIEILKNNRPIKGVLESLVIKNLFTNIHKETIDLIIKNIQTSITPTHKNKLTIKNP